MISTLFDNRILSGFVNSHAPHIQNPLYNKNKVSAPCYRGEDSGTILITAKFAVSLLPCIGSNPYPLNADTAQERLCENPKQSVLSITEFLCAHYNRFFPSTRLLFIFSVFYHIMRRKSSFKLMASQCYGLTTLIYPLSTAGTQNSPYTVYPSSETIGLF